MHRAAPSVLDRQRRVWLRVPPAVENGGQLDGSPQPGLPPVLSLATQIQRLGLKQFPINVIRVGTDANGLLSSAQEENLDCAIQVTRDIFSAAGIGIGRVERWWLIPLSDNTGFEVIDDNDEAEELVESFTVPHGGVDVFFVKDKSGLQAYSLGRVTESSSSPG